MKLRQLQCLCAVVDADFNVSRAAMLVHATQPAVSKQLRQFEEELGVDLVRRDGARLVALTEDGERVLGWARIGLQCAENIRAVARDARSPQVGTITIATSHSHANHLLLPAIRGFNERFPGVRIAVLQGAPDQVAELVRDGKAEVGVAHLPSDVAKELVAVPFLVSERLLVLPPGHPLADDPELTLQKLATFPLIIQHSMRPKGARILRTFKAAGLDVDPQVQALDADVIKTYVASGLGIGIIPAFTYDPARDVGLVVRSLGALFDPATSAVILRRRSQLRKFVYQFLAALDPSLDPARLQALVLEE